MLLQKESVEDESQLSMAKPGASFFSPPELPPPPPPPSAELFEEAWDEVSKLLQRDAFAQFRHSEVYLRLKMQWGRQVRRPVGTSILSPPQTSHPTQYLADL